MRFTRGRQRRRLSQLSRSRLRPSDTPPSHSAGGRGGERKIFVALSFVLRFSDCRSGLPPFAAFSFCTHTLSLLSPVLLRRTALPLSLLHSHVRGCICLRPGRHAAPTRPSAQAPDQPHTTQTRMVHCKSGVLKGRSYWRKGCAQSSEGRKSSWARHPRQRGFPAIVLALGAIHTRPSTPPPEPALTVPAPSVRHTSCRIILIGSFMPQARSCHTIQIGSFMPQTYHRLIHASDASVHESLAHSCLIATTDTRIIGSFRLIVTHGYASHWLVPASSLHTDTTPWGTRACRLWLIARRPACDCLLGDRYLVSTRYSS